MQDRRIKVSDGLKRYWQEAKTGIVKYNVKNAPQVAKQKQTYLYCMYEFNIKKTLEYLILLVYIIY